MAKSKRFSFENDDIITALENDLVQGQGQNQGDDEGNNNKPKETTPVTPQPQATNNSAEPEKGKEKEEKTTEETAPPQLTNAEPEAEQGSREEDQEKPSGSQVAQEHINAAVPVVTPATEKVESPAQSNKEGGAHEQKMEKAAKKFVDIFGKKVKGTSERQHLMITEDNKNRLADIKHAYGIYYQDVINNMIEYYYEQFKDVIDYKYEMRRHKNR